MNLIYKSNKKTLSILIFITLFLSIALFVAIFYYFEIKNKDKLEAIKRVNIAESYNKSIQKYLIQNYSMQLRVFIDKEIMSAVALKDRETLKPLVMRIFDRVKLKDPYIKALQFHLPDGTSFLRAHNLDEFGDNIASERKYIALVHSDHEKIFGFEEGHFPLPLYRVIEPLFLDEAYIGAVEIGVSPQKILDFVTFFDDIQGAISFYKAKEPIIFDDISNEYLLNVYRQNILGHSDLPEVIEVDKHLYKPYVFSINDFYGNRLGEFAFFDDITIFHEDFYNNLKLIGGFSIFLLLLTFVMVRLLILRHEAIIHAAHLRVQTILNVQSDIVMVTNGKELIEANSRFLRFLKYGNLKAFKENYRCICELFIPGDGLVSTYTENDLWTQYLLKNRDKENIARMQLDNEIYIFKLFAEKLNSDETVVTMQDITELKNKEKLLQDYVELVDQNLLISSTDLQGKITYVSDTLVHTSGYSKEELLGKSHRIIKHPQTSQAFYKKLWETILQDKTWHGEMKNLKKDGNYFWSDIWIYPRYDLVGAKIGYTAVRHDVTDKKLLEKMSITDGLTGLFNRRYFNEIMPKAINLRKRDSKLIGFMIIDIDYFKKFNDTYGHLQGDEALKNVANAIRFSLNRAGDYAFRLGGEEFGVVFDAESIPASLEFTQSLCKKIETLKIKHEKNIASRFVTVSIGLVCENADKIQSIGELYNKADSALYFSKHNGRNRVSLFEKRILD